MANTNRYKQEIVFLCEKGHRTAEQVFKELKKTYWLLGIGSVYRNLTELVDEDILMKTSGIAEKVLYEKKKAPHGHMFCHASGTILDIDISSLDTSKILLPAGFLLENFQIIAHGNFQNEESCKLALKVC